jgi:predicted PurR-regulated permease PerM
LVNLWWEKSNKYLTFKLERIYKKLWIWLKSQFLLCLFIWLSVYLSLWILAWFGLDLPQKWSLAMIAWLTEFIPYLWPILWGIAWVLVALIHYWIGWAFVVLAVYIIIQQLENNVIVPLLMKKTLWMNPVVIFISMILWWLIMWLIGVLLAVPIAVIGTLLIEKDFD